MVALSLHVSNLTQFCLNDQTFCIVFHCSIVMLTLCTNTHRPYSSKSSSKLNQHLKKEKCKMQMITWLGVCFSHLVFDAFPSYEGSQEWQVARVLMHNASFISFSRCVVIIIKLEVEVQQKFILEKGEVLISPEPVTLQRFIQRTPKLSVVLNTSELVILICRHLLRGPPGTKSELKLKEVRDGVKKLPHHHFAMIKNEKKISFFFIFTIISRVPYFFSFYFYLACKSPQILIEIIIENFYETLTKKKRHILTQRKQIKTIFLDNSLLDR